MEQANHPKELPIVKSHHGDKLVKSIYKTPRYGGVVNQGL